MKRSMFVPLFIVVNILFVFFLIYKNSRIVELTYAKQRHEKEREALFKQKEMVQQELCLVQNRAAIKDFATSELHMQKVKLNDIKQLPGI